MTASGFEGIMRVQKAAQGAYFDDSLQFWRHSEGVGGGRGADFSDSLKFFGGILRVGEMDIWTIVVPVWYNSGTIVAEAKHVLDAELMVFCS